MLGNGMHNIWLVQALALAKVANGNNWDAEINRKQNDFYPCRLCFASVEGFLE